MGKSRFADLAPKLDFFMGCARNKYCSLIFHSGELRASLFSLNQFIWVSATCNQWKHKKEVFVILIIFSFTAVTGKHQLSHTDTGSSNPASPALFMLAVKQKQAGRTCEILTQHEAPALSGFLKRKQPDIYPKL